MTVSENLKKHNLVTGEKTLKIFDEIFPDIFDKGIEDPANLVGELWERYNNITPALNGSVFEGILATVFFRSGIFPLYVQAKLQWVPNIDFDFIAYSQEYGPIILSAKTSLRERYKQADLEGMMVRQVHRKSKSYLITMEEKEGATLSEKIDSGLVLGIDKVIIANHSSFNELIKDLKSYNYYEPGKVDIITSSRLIK